MKKGDKVWTPRFCTVQIKEVYSSREQAREAGYTEPTHYTDSTYGVVGRSIDMYHMEFAGFRK